MVFLNNSFNTYTEHAPFKIDFFEIKVVVYDKDIQIVIYICLLWIVYYLLIEYDWSSTKVYLLSTGPFWASCGRYWYFRQNVFVCSKIWAIFENFSVFVCVIYIVSKKFNWLFLFMFKFDFSSFCIFCCHKS